MAKKVNPTGLQVNLAGVISYPVGVAMVFGQVEYLSGRVAGLTASGKRTSGVKKMQF